MVVLPRIGPAAGAVPSNRHFVVVKCSSSGNGMTARGASFCCALRQTIRRSPDNFFRPGSGGAREMYLGAWGAECCCARRSRLRLRNNLALECPDDKRIFRAAVAMSVIAQIWRTSRPSAPGREPPHCRRSQCDPLRTFSR